MLRPWVLALLAAVCAVVAVGYPSAPMANEIVVVHGLDVRESITVEIDGERIVVHALDGYAIQGWGQSTGPFIEIGMGNAAGELVYVRIAGGRGPRDGQLVGTREGRPIRVTSRGSVVWQVVPGAAMEVTSSAEPTEALVSLVHAVEVDVE